MAFLELEIPTTFEVAGGSDISRKLQSKRQESKDVLEGLLEEPRPIVQGLIHHASMYVVETSFIGPGIVEIVDFEQAI
jgi:hypothetical protein